MIFDIQRFSLHDGEGVRTVVFFKGCPLRCAWCSNPESQAGGAELFFNPDKCIGCRDCLQAASGNELTWDNGPRIRRDGSLRAGCFAGVCPAEALTVAGEDKSVAAIMAAVEKDRVFYRGKGGITLSGGEPFAQSGLAKTVLAEAKRRGLTTAVETCLAVPWKNIEPALPFLDHVYADVKHVDADKYRAGTGGDVSLSMDNLRRLSAAGIQLAARVPVIPGFNDSPGDLEAIATFIAGLGSISVMHLMPYHNYGEGKYRLLDRDYPLAGIRSTPPEALAATAASLAQRFGLTVRIGG